MGQELSLPTPLHQASAEGNIEEVGSLIAAGEDVNVQNDNGLTPLMVACIRGQPQVIEMLVRKGNADTTKSDSIGRTALHYAAEVDLENQLEIVQLLLMLGCDRAAISNDNKMPVDVTSNSLIRDILIKGSYLKDEEMTGEFSLLYGMSVKGASAIRLYEGELVQGQRVGRGKCLYGNGATYSGEWANDKPEGFGVYHDASDNRYEGTWHAGVKHGEGVWIEASGNVYEELWTNGRMLAKVEVPLVSTMMRRLQNELDNAFPFADRMENLINCWVEKIQSTDEIYYDDRQWNILPKQLKSDGKTEPDEDDEYAVARARSKFSDLPHLTYFQSFLCSTILERLVVCFVRNPHRSCEAPLVSLLALCLANGEVIAQHIVGSLRRLAACTTPASALAKVLVRSQRDGEDVEGEGDGTGETKEGEGVGDEAEVGELTTGDVAVTGSEKAGGGGTQGFEEVDDDLRDAIVSTAGGASEEASTAGSIAAKAAWNAIVGCKRLSTEAGLSPKTAKKSADSKPDSCDTSREEAAAKSVSNQEPSTATAAATDDGTDASGASPDGPSNEAKASDTPQKGDAAPAVAPVVQAKVGEKARLAASKLGQAEKERRRFCIGDPAGQKGLDRQVTLVNVELSGLDEKRKRAKTMLETLSDVVQTKRSEAQAYLEKVDQKHKERHSNASKEEKERLERLWALEKSQEDILVEKKQLEEKLREVEEKLSAVRQQISSVQGEEHDAGVAAESRESEWMTNRGSLQEGMDAQDQQLQEIHYLMNCAQDVNGSVEASVSKILSEFNSVTVTYVRGVASVARAAEEDLRALHQRIKVCNKQLVDNQVKRKEFESLDMEDAARELEAAAAGIGRSIEKDRDMAREVMHTTSKTIALVDALVASKPEDADSSLIEALTEAQDCCEKASKAMLDIRQEVSPAPQDGICDDSNAASS
eukprot:Rmarinus@m.7942